MAVNLAGMFASKSDERFTLDSVTEGAYSTDYTWNGVNTVEIITPAAVTLGTYSKTASANRFGTPAELQNTKQTLTTTQDPSFSVVIDKFNAQSTMGTHAAAKELARIQREQITPLFDIYRLGVWAASATGGNSAIVTITSANVYQTFTDLLTKMRNNLVPMSNVKVYMDFETYSFLKTGNYLLASESGMAKRGSGVLGNVDGVEIVAVPTSYLTTNLKMLAVCKDSVLAPKKLVSVYNRDNAQGFDGNVLEGRYAHDAFVLAQKINGIAKVTSA